MKDKWVMAKLDTSLHDDLTVKEDQFHDGLCKLADKTKRDQVVSEFTKALLDTGVPEAEIKALGSSLND